MAASSSNKKGTRLPAVLILVAVLLTVLTLTHQMKYRPFALLSWQEYGQLLATLFLVTLFVERASEVIVKVWREPNRQKLEQNVRVHRAYVASLPPGAPPQASSQPQPDPESDYVDWRAGTGRFAVSLSFLIGICVSLVGVRALRPILDPAYVNVQTYGHPWLLDWVDVLVTGALIGGGSAGMHHIVMAFVDIAKKVRTGPQNGSAGSVSTKP